LFALDTNSLVYFFKGLGRIGEHLRSTAPSEIGIPSVVVYELEVGISRSYKPEKGRVALDTILEVAQILPFDRSAARVAADLRRSLEKAGIGIGPMDTLIAGTAMAHSATLVTHKRREFSRVRGLKVVDWY
jgi:tRNA(fMet)-specific endonuclease VapC